MIRRVFFGCVFCVVRFILCDEIDRAAELTAAMEDQIIQEKPICIPLGFNCLPVFQLRCYGLRYMAYPFDWNIISWATLARIIMCKFKYFLDEKFIRFSANRRSGKSAVWNEWYGGGDEGREMSGFTFAHVIPMGATEENFFPLYWPELKAKMQRRINRFYKALNSGKHVYFLRVCNQATEDVSTIVAAISRKFPSLDFTLIAVFFDRCWYQESLGRRRVKSFLISPNGPWAKPDQQFKKIFQSVGLLPK